ncbi:MULTISPECIES: cell division protein ZipA C-terminal FtsZ-binding domain-containing protein [unclassified Cupriavidus]|uniref:cell division protein ZipA C-terminal FtsZ-binding domain-containing protein n=1 Tax=unclassified Cupriavidus TaxID=2640874 RepID=UPI001BFFE9C8|nr:MULTISPECIES: cell division protein ZipA C-terminal FtsZ-binding domain-containing protein [unclassified Cupriavidus]MCA3189707.1 cell division protein FtsZ [Cupriavidus sp.]MCA3196301.1 cell division protein FtsZ [Cupriavidus sp.]MCA3202046.1 cell division protein FtsZ [Cupriavidus sp.]MCA3209613.1 cell division protein FtsZ [Cupriavidus sp.]MCA3230986.1 cell division protein FtsZ [Cupriavidus sp.]
MELQNALIIAGVVLLLLLVAYNRWQIHKARRVRPLMPEDDLPPMREPVVGKTTQPETQAKLKETPPEHVSRREPTLGEAGKGLQHDAPADVAMATAAAHAAASSSDADEIVADEVAVAAAPAAGHAEARAEAHADAQADVHAQVDGAVATEAPAKAAPAAEVVPDGQPTAAVIDPLIDCIVPMHLERKASGDRILPLTGRLRRAGTKQVHIEGLRVEANAWEPVTAGHQYEDLQVAVQLANRSGPLNALEFSEFVNAVEALAEALDASADLPDMTETVANARELDSFAAGADVQLGVNVISDGAPWSAAYVQTVATQDGLVLSRDGTRFIRYEPGADGVQKPLFTLQFGDTNFLRDDLTLNAGRQITLLLDVPQGAQSIKPFKTVCEYGYSLAQRMGAQLVDDNMRPLTEASFVAIFNQLEKLYEKLEARGMPAGSPVAQRLFSV